MDLGLIGSIGKSFEYQYQSKQNLQKEVKTDLHQTIKPIKTEDELNTEEKVELQDLKRTDQKVRAHEQAHRRAGGQYIRGGVSYEYEKGPDGKQYAVGGEVSIDTSSVPDNPEATINKMQIVKKAALAPIDPSPQDRKVATEASRKEMEARKEISQEQFNQYKENISLPKNSNINFDIKL